MYLVVEVRITTLAVILNAKRLNLALIENTIHTEFYDRSKAVESGINSSFINMICKRLGGPCFNGIAKVFQLSTCNTNQPDLCITGNFLFTTTPLLNIKKVIDGFIS